MDEVLNCIEGYVDNKLNERVKYNSIKEFIDALASSDPYTLGFADALVIIKDAFDGLREELKNEHR